MKNLLKKILIRPFKTNIPRFSNHYSESTTEQNPYYSCDTIRSNGFRILNFSLCHRPVNVLSIDFMERMNSFFQISKGDSIDAMIIKSSIPGIFSAGLDLRSLLVDKESNLDHINKFLSVFLSFWLSLYSLEFPVVSVIGGTCLAAGCSIALATDYRIMFDGPYKIGITATKLGISPPIWFRQVLSDVIGFAQADRALQLSKLFSPQEALRINLVDQIVPAEDCDAAALSVVEDFLRVNSQARTATKLNFRKHLIKELEQYLAEDLDDFIRILSSESTQKIIRELLKKTNK